MVQAGSSSNSAAASKDRDQRLQSAKKKVRNESASSLQDILIPCSLRQLKSYRAKQAQMEKSKRQSMLGSTSSLSVSPTRLVGSVLNDASHESQMSMMGSSGSKRSSLRLSASFDKRHSRNLSRSGTGAGAGHLRGHSRTGSISLSQNALADGVMAAALDHISHIPSLSFSRPPSTHIANTPHSHTRGHSRSGSRNIAASRSRPTSFIGSAARDPKAWIDDSISPAEELFRTPLVNRYSFAAPAADASPQQRLPASSSMPTMTIIQATPTAAPTSHTRRPSRHARKGSVSTRRESMEIMGGLTTQDNHRQSRRISSNRWSGLQSASVLFGGGPDFSLLDQRRESAGSSSDDEGGDRLTALEKLEGKRPRESAQSSVQLPSFDDVHGEEAMDKRASLHLIEANAQTTSSERLPAPVIAPAARPLTMIESNKDLCMVIEEEEEEEDGSVVSPVKERGGIDFVAEEEARRRKEAEQEVIKRNRRGSLTPRPLKLKSRPASLFVAPRSTRLTASQSYPDLNEQSVEEEHEGEVEDGEEEKRETLDLVTPLSTPAQSTPTTSNISSAQQHALRPLHTAGATSTPSKETKRAWRSSMPVAVNRSPLQMNGTPSPSSTSASSRQGMRALRLGSNTSASSNASPLNRQHKVHNDSTSSLASIASNSSAAISKRGSLLYNASSMSSSTSREDVSSTSLAKRRGSLLYKTSPMDAASSAPATELSFLPNTSLPSSAPASITAGAGAGVPLGMFEELKSKHQRDVVLLDDARSKIARLEGELMSEAERRTQELAEVEQWSAEEKRSLGQRIEDLEASIVQLVQVRNAKELSLIEERERIEEDLVKVKGDFEDVEAERDMLREDVDGWRTRCSDLEKSLRIERRVNDDLKRIKGASRQRIKELLTKLHDAGIQVEGSPMDEEEVSADLVAILKSPPMGASSPSLHALREGSGSGSGSPFNAEMPNPQAVQLLKDMRQQIFNLAGSLEHERKQHLLAQQELEEVKANMGNLRPHSLLDETANTTMPTMDSLLSTPEKGVDHDNSPSTSTPPHASGLGSPVKSIKKKRNHVFAYDSSMESGFGSNEMGSGSVTTYQTSHDEDELSVNAKDDEAFVARVQADLAGLGMGTLGTVEEEESAQDQEVAAEAARTPPRDSMDIESGRRASDVESVAPPTPALEHTYQYSESVPPPPASNTKEQTSLRSSASSSLESHGPASPLAQTSGGSSSSHHNIAAQHDLANDVYTDDSYNDERSSAPRPEFIREWSFQQATAAVQKNKTTKPAPRTRPTVVTSGLRKTRPMSIDDFFGIMTLDEDQTLPPLPTPDEALEMPPIYIEDSYSTGKPYGYGASPRYPSSIRAPVPRSSAMYARTMSDRSSTSSRHSSLYNQKGGQAQQQQLPGNDSAAFAASSAAAAIGGGMFSRVASLTSAFSGYLIGASTSNDYDSSNSSWAVTRREEELA